MTAGMPWSAFQACFKGCRIYLTLRDMWVWKHCFFPCFQTNLIFIVSACSHCVSLVVHWHGDWPAVSPRKGPERLCMAIAQATQQWWKGSCLIFSSKPLPDVASDNKTLTDSEFPEKGEFPQRKNENTHAFKSFQTDSGKKKSLSTMEGLLGVFSSSIDISFFHQQLQLAWQKWIPHND